jgi:hypothetical protein
MEEVIYLLPPTLHPVDTNKAREITEGIGERV